MRENVWSAHLLTTDFLQLKPLSRSCYFPARQTHAPKRRVPIKPMRKIPLAVAVVVILHTTVFATWPVVAVNRKTGQIVISSATCVPQQAFAGFPAKGLKDVQAIIIPGVGIAAAQANVDRTRKLQALVAAELNKHTDPARIIDMLLCNTPPDPPPPCDNKTAHVAYLVVANKSDKMGQGLNDGNYYLEIQVTDQNIKPDENDNPVKALRMRYDPWMKGHAVSRRS